MMDLTVEQTVLVASFTVLRNPLGYYAQASRSLWKMSPDQRKRAEAYREYCEHVRIEALQAGIPLPLNATREEPLYIMTVAYFKHGVHCDSGNVQKGVCDALFRGSIGGDKFTGGSFEPPRYDPERPRVEVEIRRRGK